MLSLSTFGVHYTHCMRLCTPLNTCLSLENMQDASTQVDMMLKKVSSVVSLVSATLTSGYSCS